MNEKQALECAAAFIKTAIDLQSGIFSDSERLAKTRKLRNDMGEEQKRVSIYVKYSGINRPSSIYNVESFYVDALTHTVGRLTNRSCLSFLYDVRSYGGYHLRKVFSQNGIDFPEK